MKTYQLSTPPRMPGIYLIRHKPTDRLYVGRSLDLFRRYSDWKLSLTTHLGIRSSAIKELAKQSCIDDWEFSTLIVYPGATDEQLSEYENRAVSKIGGSSPDRLLNTIMPSTPQTPRPPGGTTSPKSVITLEGKPTTYSSAAKILGCTPKQVQKRMARYRGRGVYEVEVEELKTLSEKYRA